MTNRRPVVPPYLVEPYYPEHERLNVSPYIPGPTQQKKQPAQVQRTVQQMPPPQRPQRPQIPQQPRPVAPNPVNPRLSSEIVVPKQTRVHVSGHEENLWVNGLAAGNPPLPTDNNEEMDVEAIQGHNPLEGDYTQEDWTQPPPQQAEPAGDESLQVNDYALFYRGEMIVKSGDVSVIKAQVEDLLLQDADMSDIIVVKRLSVDYGITIE